MTRNVVGISAHCHDAACCLLEDGVLTAAAQEESFSRVEHDPKMPLRAFQYCLRQGGLELPDVDCVAYYENPIKKAARQLWMAAADPQAPSALLSRIDPSRAEHEIRELLGYEGEVLFFDHHQSHAASAYYFSGFPQAAILTVDGVGEWATTTYGCGSGQEMSILEEVEFPDSLGLLYSAITGYLGFDVNDAEYTVMGLAPYGEPRYVEQIRSLLTIEEQGQYRLDREYFDFYNAERMYAPALIDLFGRPPREPESELGAFHQDVAHSLQVVLEETLLQKVRYLHGRVGSEHLCLAGGVALNSAANRRLLRDGPFKRMFVQPAAHDAGGCLGAAALAHKRIGGRIPQTPLEQVYLGPAFDDADVRRLLEAAALAAQDFHGDERALLDEVACRLARGEIVGWFHGRMEFGPRALGARSILADPRLPEMRDRVNRVVKKREAFRPFAAAVPTEHAANHFLLDHPLPFMVETCQVSSPLSLPAITHVDGSAQVQTVSESASPRLWRLLQAFARQTGCPVLLNTSFNVRGQPIVCSPADAVLCFAMSGLDALVLEDHLVTRSGVPAGWPAMLNELQRTPVRAVSQSVYTLL